LVTGPDEPLRDPSPISAPMKAAEAEAFFRYLVASDRLRLDFARHARKRLSERGLSAIDVRRLMEEGKVMRSPKEVDRLGRSKYTLEGLIGGNEEKPGIPARIVVLAAPRNPLVHVITTMRIEAKRS